MAFIGSFALLLALALSIYSFGVGLLALFFPGDKLWERLGENCPARRHRRLRIRCPSRYRPCCLSLPR